MSGDSLTTQVDRGYLDPEIRARAARYLVRTDNADLLVILGLAVESTPALGRRCPTCARPMPGDARESCRAEKCVLQRLETERARRTQAYVTGTCELCGNKLPSRGVCRRSKACRKAAPERGESA